jgi:hypothetical protein
LLWLTVSARRAAYLGNNPSNLNVPSSAAGRPLDPVEDQLQTDSARALAHGVCEELVKNQELASFVLGSLQDHVAKIANGRDLPSEPECKSMAEHIKRTVEIYAFVGNDPRKNEVQRLAAYKYGETAPLQLLWSIDPGKLQAQQKEEGHYSLLLAHSDDTGQHNSDSSASKSTASGSSATASTDAPEQKSPESSAQRNAASSQSLQVQAATTASSLQPGLSDANNSPPVSAGPSEQSEAQSNAQSSISSASSGVSNAQEQANRLQQQQKSPVDSQPSTPTEDANLPVMTSAWAV